MGKYIDLTGKRYGRLTVISRAENKNGRIHWNCVCDCGGIAVCSTSNLKSGNSQSCGCIHIETVIIFATTHGLSKKYKSEYSIWKAMIKRCYNENSSNYQHYGGRGISVCDKWKNSFENFLNDMGEKPSINHSIDRIDVNGNYEHSNCKWASKKEQARNRRAHSNTGVTGVSFNKRLNKYQAKIKVNGKSFHLGIFETIEEATKARKDAEKYYWNEGNL